MQDRHRHHNFRASRSGSGGFVRVRRKGPKRRRRSSAMLLFIALAMAVLIAGFLIRRITQPVRIRYVVPPHPRPATELAPPGYAPDGVGAPPAGPDARNNPGASLRQQRAGNGVALGSGEQLTPQDRQRLNSLIQRKLNQ